AEAAATEPEELAPEEAAPAADVTDPDDIDALLDSVAEEPAPAADVTDPDDIDALLDSVAEEPAPAADVTDPDDIDALLDSVAEEPAPAADVTDPDDIDALLDSMDIDIEPAPEADVSNNEQASETDKSVDIESDNSESDESISAAKIEQFTEEYVAPFLNADFGDLSTEKTNEEPGKPLSDINDLSSEEAESDNNEQQIAQFTEEYVTPFLNADFSDHTDEKSTEVVPERSSENKAETIEDDDLDIDALLDENSVEQEDVLADIGDSLTGITDNEIDSAVNHDFDEEMLNNLLSENIDEQGSPADDNVENELGSDFTDKDVLASLLTEDNESKSTSDSSTTEIEDIKELDNVDFDELLANIEEENHSQVEVNTEDEDIGDSLLDGIISNESSTSNENQNAIVSDNVPSESDSLTKESAEYVSVDTLLSQSMTAEENNEPYEKTNIDVGLGEYSLYDEDNKGVDVDSDNSMSAKLELAKVYLEMDDADSAQVILEEVISKGNNEEQLTAKTLLEGL
ncbi:hypothetical protein KO495_11385, partial [Colwellia sp. D2M02]|uniref:FimV/HubP family polar landmark protein n=1 Tax=Colwellia sp. D2M02 TaxID=2841562 RepID=UPI001C0966AC